jgi:hypothetical protein
MSQATSPSTGQPYWSGARLPRVGRGAFHPLLAATRVLCAWCPARASWSLYG